MMPNKLQYPREIISPSAKADVKRSTFLKMIDCNKVNLEFVIDQKLRYGTEFAVAGQELTLPCSGFFIEADDPKAYVDRLMNFSPHPTSHITLAKFSELPADCSTLEKMIIKTSAHTDGAMIFNDEFVSVYDVLDLGPTAATVGLMWELINKYDSDGRADRFFKYYMGRYHSSVDTKRFGLSPNNPIRASCEEMLKVSRHLYSRIVEPCLNTKIKVFSDIKRFITPAKFSFMGEDEDENGDIDKPDQDQMGAKTKFGISMATLDPDITVYLIKHTVYGPKYGSTTGTGKVVQMRYDSDSKIFRYRESFFILAHPLEYLFENLRKKVRADLVEIFDPNKHTVVTYLDSHQGSTPVAACVYEYEGNLLEPRKLPLTCAYFLEYDAKSGFLSFPRSVVVPR